MGSKLVRSCHVTTTTAVIVKKNKSKQTLWPSKEMNIERSKLKKKRGKLGFNIKQRRNFEMWAMRSGGR